MTADEFIQKWETAINHLGLRSVGINVRWNKILSNSLVKQYVGKEAWEKIYITIPPWFKKPKTFKKLGITKDSDYLQILKEETNNGKIQYYRNNGLKEPYFCAFATKDGSFIILGDGNHRFFDCTYLIDHEKHSFELDITRACLDIIYLENFEEILETEKIWGQSYA